MYDSDARGVARLNATVVPRLERRWVCLERRRGPPLTWTDQTVLSLGKSM